MRQAIVDLHTEYPQHHVEEIARIMYIPFGRRPSAQTIKLTLADGPKPSHSTRRFPLFSEMIDPRERRLAIIKLHKEMPFKAERRHQFWSVDIRHIDMHHIEGEDKIY